jgi:hypothetical protein
LVPEKYTSRSSARRAGEPGILADTCEDTGGMPPAMVEMERVAGPRREALHRPHLQRDYQKTMYSTTVAAITSEPNT